MPGSGVKGNDMRRLIALIGSLALLTVLMVGTALGSPDHDTGPLEEHPHALVLGVEVDESDNPISVRKCVDLAANQPIPVNAHHVHVHAGQAGEALSQNGNFVIPLAPFPEPFAPGLPWSDCDSLLAFSGL